MAEVIINKKVNEREPWNLFISWHDDKTDKSRRIVLELKKFISFVVPRINVFCSASISSGEWSEQVDAAFKECQFAIFLLMDDAIKSHWITFECGAFYMKALLQSDKLMENYVVYDIKKSASGQSSPIKKLQVVPITDKDKVLDYFNRLASVLADDRAETRFINNWDKFQDNRRAIDEDDKSYVYKSYVDGTQSLPDNPPSARPFDGIDFSYDEPVTTSNEKKVFFGRRQFVENLHRRFFEQGQNCINVVAKGGMGKTSIAYIYVRDYGKEYKKIQFVVCNDDILSDFNDELRKRICKVDYYRSKFPPQEVFLPREFKDEDREKLKQTVRDNINDVLSDADKSSKNLLVIDVNIDKDGLQSIYMPQGVKDKWHILYLSREYVNGTLKLPLYNFKDQDDDFDGAKGLFEHIYKRKKFEKNQLEELFDSIYYHPLLIEQLAQYGNDYEFDKCDEFSRVIAEGSTEITENFSPYTINYKGKDYDIMRYVNKFFNIRRYSADEQYVIKHFASWEYDFIPFGVIDDLLNLESKRLRKIFNDLVDKVIFLKSNETDSYRIHGLLKEKLRDDIKKYDGFGDYFDNVRDVIANDAVDENVQKCIKCVDYVYFPWLMRQPHTSLPPEQTDKDGYTFVNIPVENYGEIKMMKVRGGSFMMGGDFEKPIHKVFVDDFYIGETQVTQSLWMSVMKDSKLEKRSSFKYGGQYPVESVSWYDCIAFIMKLNEKTGMCFRFPTEAEWEYAARGGENRCTFQFSGSKELSDVAWYGFYDDKEKTTMPVKLKLPNALGIYDMSGNVFEWCEDWYDKDYYQKCKDDTELCNNPQGPASGASRVLRGGSWSHSTDFCRVSYRYNGVPYLRYDDRGFRLLLSSPKKEKEEK